MTRRRTKARPGTDVDLVREHPAAYKARPEPALVELGEAMFLTASGRGDPNGADFQETVAAVTRVELDRARGAAAARGRGAAGRIGLEAFAEGRVPPEQRRTILRVPVSS